MKRHSMEFASEYAAAVAAVCVLQFYWYVYAPGIFTQAFPHVYRSIIIAGNVNEWMGWIKKTLATNLAWLTGESTDIRDIVAI